MSSEDGGNPSFMYEEGQSMKTIFAVKSKGIDPSNGKEIYVKKDGTETYTWNPKDKVACGIDEPKIWGNLNTMFRYKGITLNAIFSYRYGGQMYNYTLVNKVENIKPFDNADKRVLTQRWQKPGDVTPLKNIADRNRTTQSTSRFVQDNNEFSINSLSLSYDFNPEWVRRIGLDVVRIQASTNDLATFSSIKQERGLDYPFARTFNFGLSVSF